jgi:NADH-quinone oxidoreductase subunit N
VGYYFKLIVAMYTKEASEKETTPTPFVYYFVAVVAILLNIIIGIFPNIILNLLGA